MSISDEAVCCTGQIEMLNGLLKSNLIGSCCCARVTVAGVINSSTATFNACSLMVTVIQAENFKQINSGSWRSKHLQASIQYMGMLHVGRNVYSFGTDKKGNILLYRHTTHSYIHK